MLRARTVDGRRVRDAQCGTIFAALKIELSSALRPSDQVLSLVRAVYDAAPEDETRAVEWKSGYADLTSQEASFAISRAILGLANRPVAVAAASLEGVGYVLVGVEPGAMNGQPVPDSAELLNAVHRYTGHRWPHWDARTLVLNDVSVLVVVVEPPRKGDRIASLQKAYQPKVPWFRKGRYSSISRVQLGVRLARNWKCFRTDSYKAPRWREPLLASQKERSNHVKSSRTLCKQET